MGGNPSPPKTYSPQEQAQAQIQIEEAAARRAAEQQAAERARVEAERQQNMQRTQSDVARLYSGGQNWGQNRLNTLGFQDTYGIMDAFNQQLDSAKNLVPSVSDNVGSYFNYDTLWNNAYNQTQSSQQSKLDNAFRALTPVGWQEQQFSNTSDDAILDAILNSQYQDAANTFDAARKRGQLSQGAYDNTLRGLDQKKLAARSTLEDLGQGVLSGYRDQLTGLGKQYGDQITNYKLGQNFDVNSFTDALQGKKTDLMGRMQGDIYKALGDTSLFSTDALMARGNAAAGTSNNPLQNAFKNNSDSYDPRRTTGTTGVF